MNQVEPRLLSEMESRPFALYKEHRESDDPIEIMIPIGHYPLLATLVPDLDYSQHGLEQVDALLEGHRGTEPSEPLAHDVAFYLCDWLVANEGLKWRLRGDGLAELQLNEQGALADPYRAILTSIENRQPLALRFIEHCQGMIRR